MFFIALIEMGQSMAKSPPVLPASYPLGTAWEHIRYVATLLGSLENTALILDKLSQDLDVPFICLSENVTEQEICQEYVMREGSQHLFAAWINLPHYLFGDDEYSHAVGMVADFSASNKIHLFDPNGPTQFREKDIVDYLVKVMTQVIGAIMWCQHNKLLPKIPGPFEWNIVEIAKGVQTVQADAFLAYGIDFPGTCSFMTTHLLWQYVRHDGKMNIQQITDVVNKDWLRFMADFARVIWLEAIGDKAYEKQFKLSLRKEMQREAFVELPEDKLMNILNNVSQHASASLHARISNENTISSASYTTPTKPTKPRRSKRKRN